MKKYILALIIILLSFNIFADEFDDIFSEENMFEEMEEEIVEEKDIVSKNAAIELEEISLGVSGEITSYTKHIKKRTWISETDYNDFNNYVIGNVYVDARLKENFKGYASFELEYNPNGIDSLDYSLKEIFMDSNIDKKVYFRLGKQNLKWGRGYFWNPSDLINIDKKDFLNMDKNKEGVYGLKTHIPFGAEKNLYLFIDTNNVEDTEDISASAKYEFLIKNSEFSVSAWNKLDSHSKFAMDFSTNIFDIDLFGEMIVYGKEKKLSVEGSKLKVEEEMKAFSDIAVGASKYFDFGDIKDRIMIIGEFYYNSGGYEGTELKKLDSEEITKYLMNGYEPYNDAKYYAALFSIFSYLFNDSNKSLDFNIIGNLSDNSYIFTTGINYEPVDNFTVKLSTNYYYGKRETEIGITENRSITELKLNLKF